MPSHIEVPTSVADYFLKPGVRPAVDSLLVQSPDDIPTDLNWEEVCSYHDAILQAQKVRYDYIRLLFDVWQRVWKPALDNGGISSPLALTELDKEELPSPKVIWEDCLYRYFVDPEDPGMWIGTAVVVNEPAGAVIYYARGAENEPPELRAGEVPSELWKTDLEDDVYRATRSRQCRIDAPTLTIDITPLERAAKDAVSMLTGR